MKFCLDKDSIKLFFKLETENSIQNIEKIIIIKKMKIKRKQRKK